MVTSNSRCSPELSARLQGSSFLKLYLNRSQGCCLIEFQEWAAAEAAAAHMAGDWGLPVQPVDGSTASYYLQLAQ
ncbi:CCC1, partial [Symbiodinium sp. CCMP2456]